MRCGRVVALAAAAMAAAGCSQEISGTPAPAGVSSASPSTPGRNDTPLRDLDPCALITAVEARELGGPERGTPDKLARSRGCGWTVSGSHLFGVALFDDMGIGDLTLTGQRTTVTIAGRSAERVEGSEGSGGCVVIFPITDDSVAEAGAQTLTDTAKACLVAEQVAWVIAPKLP